MPPRAQPAALVRAAPERASVTGRLRALPDHRWLDTLLRSRAWIWLLGIALGGIVAMQVSLLKMNASIGRAVQAGAALEHANAKLEKQVAELSSGARISAAAAGMGLITPDAGSVDYLTVRPGLDPLRAAQNMTDPSDAARALLASGGRAPAGSTAVTPATSAPTGATTVPQATAAPASMTTTTAPAPAAAPVATATPAPPAAAPVAAEPGTPATAPVVTAGAVAAPDGP